MPRIATFAQQKLLVFHSLRTQERLYDNSIKLASGQKSQQYSGIARDTNRLLAVETAKKRAEQYLHNIEVTNRRVKLTDDNLDGVENIARQLRSILENVGDAPATNHTDLRTYAINARSLLIEHMNSRDGDRYLFSGTRVDKQTATLDPAVYTPMSFIEADAITVDDTFYADYRANVLGTPGYVVGTNTFYDQIYFDKNGVLPTGPFPADRDNPTLDEFVAEDPDLWTYYVTRMSSAQMTANPKLDYYQGSGDTTTVRISEITTIPYGIRADEDALQQMFLLLDSIANLPQLAPPEAYTRELINEGLSMMNRVIDADPSTTFESITELRGRNLGPLSLLDITEKAHGQFIDHAINVIGDTEGIEEAEVISLIQTEQTVLEASYRTVAQVQSLSLVQFIN